MNEATLISQLEEEHVSISLLRERVSELRNDFDDLQQSIEVYYAVDFSELYSYLNFEREDLKENIGVNLDTQHPEKNALHYRLGLTHLFSTFNGTLYVLPPHTLELWTYVRTQGHRGHDAPGKYKQLLEHARALAPEHKELLESLRDPLRAQAVSERLLEFIKSTEFGPLCLDVSEFVEWFKSGNRFKELVQSKKLAYNIDLILSKYSSSFSQVKGPSRESILRVLDKTSPKKRHRRRRQAIIDSRAILLLKEVNQLLKPANAKLVLITRDSYIFALANSLANESWFDWPEMRQHLRGIESIFLDLVLRGTASDEERSGWVLESDLKLASMQESVLRTLLQLKHPKPSRGSVNPLAAIGKKVLDETGQLWDQHINLKLSLASRNVPWLGRNFLELPTADLPADFVNYQREYNQLKNLLEFLSTQVYQNLASSDVQSLWSEIDADCLRMGFLNLLGTEGAQRVSRVLTETFQGEEGRTRTLVRSKRFLRMPSVQFVSKPYQDRLQALRVQNHAKYDQAFLSLVYEAASGLNEPEDFLFMAFVLGMIDEWSEALKLIEKCSEIVKALHPAHLSSLAVPSEISYLRSLAKRRIAELENDPVIASRGYLEAYRDIACCLVEKPEDPRYVKEAAAIAMLYHEAANTVPSLPQEGKPIVFRENADIPTEFEAKHLYKHALQLLDNHDDLRLRVSVLNNLAYSEVMGSPPQYNIAEKYLNDIDELIDKELDHPGSVSLVEGILANIADTRIMLRARIAKDNLDTDLLESCRQELETLLQQDGLSRAEQNTYNLHGELISKWQTGLVKGERTKDPQK